MVRWGIKRGAYNIAPGLYALNAPTPDTPVLVTANYKLTFDILRRSLAGFPAWILVLDTNGINVWCAAGKGTFGTAELIRRIEITQLKNIVGHRQIIVPQLGATGIAAHEVKTQSGFKVVYGPVRADDLPDFFNNQNKVTPEMRKVRFSLWDRLVLTPVELVHALIPLALATTLLTLLLGPANLPTIAIRLSLAVLSGALFTPALLPWIPTAPFSSKGAIAGLLTAGIAWLILPSSNLLLTVAWLLSMVAISSFLAMNFTGSSTYTSVSGVKKEMRVAIPIQVAGFAIGMALLILSKFI